MFVSVQVTKAVIPRINKIMQEQHAIIEALVSASEREITHEEENQLLNRICFLSARAEEMVSCYEGGGGCDDGGGGCDEGGGGCDDDDNDDDEPIGPT
jgi:hypothetical protein